MYHLFHCYILQPNRIACGTCQHICSSAWSLIQHVQEKHGVKLCAEALSPSSTLSGNLDASPVGAATLASSLLHGGGSSQQQSSWRSNPSNNSNRSSPSVIGSSVGARVASPSPILGNTLLGVSSISNHLHSLSTGSTSSVASPVATSVSILGSNSSNIPSTASMITSSSNSGSSSRKERETRSSSREGSRERSSSNSSALMGTPVGLPSSGGSLERNGRNALVLQIHSAPKALDFSVSHFHNHSVCHGPHQRVRLVMTSVLWSN
ncbi:hypothetical protein Ocin01_12308 [Orchesella cincta]|uniref:C2H2-type domain-containing protein n=1 Tax=Orchesella cincta TaxID=48709 RepID=A0A1D2MN10_ORCCI|nr:hypothetical protein Ocin01_12308 [Orchesella cincta]